jgi:hypothetical protein
MDSLRAEIVKAEEQRHELFKWKLALVATLGATGLGLSSMEAVGEGIDYVLCMIPVVCAYVDLLCRHMNLRIIVIGRFLMLGGVSHEQYEKFANRARHMAAVSGGGSGGKLDAYRLEDWGLEWSTGILSGALIAYGVMAMLFRPASFLPFLHAGAFILSGIVGVVLSLVIKREYERRWRAIQSVTLP